MHVIAKPASVQTAEAGLFHRTSVSTRVTTGSLGLQDPKCSSILFSVPNDPKEAAPGFKEANMPAEGGKVTHAVFRVKSPNSSIGSMDLM